MAQPKEALVPKQSAGGNSGEEQKAKQKERDRIVEQYMPFATYIVRKVSKTVGGNVDFDDLLSYAKVGLIEAAERFDARYKVDFRTFAFYRIRGAIYDGLRTTGWLSRTQFARHQFEEASNNYLKSLSDRTAAGAAQTHESPVAEMEDAILNLANVYIMSLDAAEGIQVKDTSVPSVEDSCELSQTRDRVREAIDGLPEKEQQLIRLYYYGGMTLDEAGESLGLSRSWTSRLHTRALELLQKIIKDNAEDGELDGLMIPVKKVDKEKTKKHAAVKKSSAKETKKSEKPRVRTPDTFVGNTRC